MSKTAYIVTAKAGLEAFVYTEVRELRALGCDIVLFTTKFRDGPYMPEPGWGVYKLVPAEVVASQLLARVRYGRKYDRLLAEAIGMGTLPDFMAAAHYARVMEKEGIGHIHCHMGDRKLFIGHYVHHLTGLPLTVTVHAHEMVGSGPKADHRMFRHALASCDRVLTISDYNKRYMIEHHGIPAEKIRVVRLFTGRARVEGLRRRTKLMMVANHVPKKGHEFLFSALKSLDRDDWELWVVGRQVDLGPERTIDVPAMISGMELGDQVKLMGQVSDDVLNALFHGCDIFLVPSVTEHSKDGGVIDQEGIPEVLKEAMIYGKPVIATRHVGMPEIANKCLVGENDVPGLAKVVASLLDSPEHRRKVGLANRERAASIYDNSDLNFLKGLYHGSKNGA